MIPKQSKRTDKPGYPTRKQFLERSAAAGLAALGIGSAIAAEPIRLAGVPLPPKVVQTTNNEARLLGEIAVDPRTTAPTNAPASTNSCSTNTPPKCSDTPTVEGLLKVEPARK